MKTKQPLNFSQNLNNSTFLKDKIFSNNAGRILFKLLYFNPNYIYEGFALLIITIIGYSLLIWDILIMHNIEKFKTKFNKKSSFLSKVKVVFKNNKIITLKKWSEIEIIYKMPNRIFLIILLGLVL
jgi:hypothetical protein